MNAKTERRLERLEEGRPDPDTRQVRCVMDSVATSEQGDREAAAFEAQGFNVFRIRLVGQQ